MAFWQHCFYFHIYMSKVALSLNNTHDKKRQKEKCKKLAQNFFLNNYHENVENEICIRKSGCVKLSGKLFFPKFSFKKGIGLVNIFCTKNIQYFHFDYKIRNIKIKDLILEFLL